MLCDAAAAAGVDCDEAMRFLESDEGLEEIGDAQDMLQEMGIHSIPNFVIGGKVVVSGAVHAAELVQIFRRFESAGEGAPGSAFADALRIPPEMRAKTLPAPGNA